MRGAKKEQPKNQLETIPQADKPEIDKLMAVVTQSAKEAAQSARDTAAIAKIALENENYEELREAITSMADSVNKMALALDNKFVPLRVVPKRSSPTSLPTHYDILPLTKKVY